jgi:hypothetical protein
LIGANEKSWNWDFKSAGGETIVHLAVTIKPSRARKLTTMHRQSFLLSSLRQPLSSRRTPFHSRFLATQSSLPQTLIEKIVQSYAVDVQEGKKVKSGDYVMIKPKHVWVSVHSL